VGQPITKSEEFALVDGLDTKDGLARVAGNRKLYSKLLRQFIEQQGPFLDQISAAIERGDATLAERLAHTLKGVAGNIGAKAVQLSAGALEKLIRERADPVEVKKGLSGVDTTLRPLLTALVNLSGSEPPETPPPPPLTQMDPAQVRAVAKQLAKLLSEFDASAADFLEKNRSALHSLFSDNSWKTFEKLVQAYAFSEAEAELAKALNALSPG
jgi:two-component system sensor histidine kinase/response regulator